MGFYSFNQIDGLRYAVIPPTTATATIINAQKDNLIDSVEMKLAIEKFTSTLSWRGPWDTRVREYAIEALPMSIKKFFANARVEREERIWVEAEPERRSSSRGTSSSSSSSSSGKTWVKPTDGHGHGCDDGHCKHDKHSTPGYYKKYYYGRSLAASGYYATKGQNLIDTKLLAEAVCKEYGGADGLIDKTEFRAITSS